MGRPRPKVSKSTVKGHPFAVKVMRRAMQAELDNDRTLNPHSPESSDEPGDPELAPDNGALDDTATTSTAETRKGGSGAGADDNNSQVTFQFPLDMNTAELVEIMKKKIADKTISSVDGAAAAAAAAAMAAVRGGSGSSSNGGSVEGAAAATAAALAAAARSSSNEPRGLGAASVAVAAAASFAAGMTDSSNDSQASVALQIYDKFDDLMVDFQKEITGKMLNGSFDEFLQIYKKVLDRNLDTSKFDGKTAAKRVDDRRNIKEVLDDDESYEDLDDEYDENNDDDYDDDAGECEECCSNPDCENFTVEAVAGLSVPIYSVLIRTNIEYAHHQTNSKPRRATIGGNSNSSSNNNNNNNNNSSSSSGTGTNNDLIPANMLTSPLLIFSYVRDNLHYGKSGDKLNIFKTIRTYYDPSNRDTPAAADPPFFARLDQLIHEEEELKQFSGVNDVLKRERERSRYSTGYSFPGDRSARAYPKSGNGGSDNDSESCNPRTTFSLTPANYGDFVLTIPVLDFVKPIVRDGYVILNGRQVRAQVFHTGTDFMPSFQSLFETLFTDIPGSWALTGGKSITPAAFEYNDQPDNDNNHGGSHNGQAGTKKRTKNIATTPNNSNHKSTNNSSLNNEEMAIALRGFVALELRQGILNQRVSHLQDMIAKGTKIINEKDCTAN